MPEEPTRGLEGVVVSDSTISFIDGQQGILRYRGTAIDELATHSSYEETAYLLLYGGLPTQEQLDEFSAELASERELDDSVWNMLTSFPCWPQPMEALRTAVSSLSSCDPNAADDTREANIGKAIHLIAKMPTIVAYYNRYVRGYDCVAPDPELSHAANFLYMLRGEPPARWTTPRHTSPPLWMRGSASWALAIGSTRRWTPGPPIWRTWSARWTKSQRIPDGAA